MCIILYRFFLYTQACVHVIYSITSNEEIFLQYFVVILSICFIITIKSRGVFSYIYEALCLLIYNSQGYTYTTGSLFYYDCAFSCMEYCFSRTDEFQFCCLAQFVSDCQPAPDEFSSCEDLMSNHVLRISIWVLGVVSLVGNGVVIFWRMRDLHDSKVSVYMFNSIETF